MRPWPCSQSDPPKARTHCEVCGFSLYADGSCEQCVHGVAAQPELLSLEQREQIARMVRRLHREDMGGCWIYRREHAPDGAWSEED